MLDTLSIRTDRLELVPACLTHVLAELSGRQALATLLCVDVPASWPPGEYDRDALEFFKSKLEGAAAEHRGWYSWYVMSLSGDGARQSLVAAAGYLGPPSDGGVEIGYSVVPEVRGNGYATEIVEALVKRAFQVQAVSRVVAHTQAGNIASASVLSRCGFHIIGAGPDPGSTRYERGRTQPRNPIAQDS